MESQNLNSNLRMPELSVGSAMVLEPPVPRVAGNALEAGVSKLPKFSSVVRLKKK